MDNGEVHLGLVEPGRVDRGVDEHEVRPGALETVDAALAAVRGAVVDDHEHALGVAVGLDGHTAVDEVMRLAVALVTLVRERHHAGIIV